MPCLLAAALHRQARRLVEGNDMVVAVDHGRPDHLLICVRDSRRVAGRGGAGLRQGRNTHLLPFFQTGVGLDPAALDAQFTLAAHLFDAALLDMRKMPAQPALQPLIPFARGDRYCLNTTHAHSILASQTPAARAAMDSTTESRTYTPACTISPRSYSVNASSEKAENVVKPPRMPDIRKGFRCCR